MSILKKQQEVRCNFLQLSSILKIQAECCKSMGCEFQNVQEHVQEGGKKYLVEHEERPKRTMTIRGLPKKK